MKILRTIALAVALVCALTVRAQNGQPPVGSNAASGGGAVSSLTCSTADAFVYWVSSGTLGCDSSIKTNTSGELILSAAGAASTPSLSVTGAPFTGGTGTTTVPLFYFNGGTAPTTWATNGTFLGVNAPSAYNGNFLDYHINGGGSLFSVGGNQGNITSSGQVQIGASTSFRWTGHSQLFSTADGVILMVNNASTGFTRLAIGNDTTAFPALCPITGTTPYVALDVAAACTTPSFVKTAQTLQVTGSDFTCTTGCTSLATITGLSVALPTVATNWSFDCNLIVSQATGAVSDQIGVQTATNAPTNLAATGTVYTAAAVSTSASIVAVSSTSSQSVVTFTPGATGTNLPIHLSGTVEGASTSGTTLNIQILTGSSSDAITIRRGSACWVY